MMVRFFVLLVITLPLGNAFAGAWVYYDVREPKQQFLLERDPDRSAWLDRVGEAKFCKEKAVYQCFNAENFKFAVPRRFTGEQTGWDFDGVSYRVTGTTRRQILGRMYTAYFIEQDLDSHRFRFVFTKEMGLIAITTIGVSNMVLILGEKCGFAAPARCSKSGELR